MVQLLKYCVLLLSLCALAKANPVNATEVRPQNAKPIIGAHLVVWNVSLKNVLWFVDLMELHGYNTLVLQLRSGVKLKHSPWTPLKTALSEADLRLIKRTANAKGIEIIPEVKLLTHQEKFFQDNYPELLFNSVSYDPRKLKTYDLVFKFLDEIIDIFTPSAIHIGHDESPGWDVKFKGAVLDDDDPVLPAELFLKDVELLTDYLSANGVATWMWGDMLLEADELPSMKQRHLHGGYEGYGKELRRKLNKDIVILDWHYEDHQKDFPSINKFNDDGFKVIGASFKRLETMRNFAVYASDHGAFGMVATTWYLMPHQKFDQVEEILEKSSEAFQSQFQLSQ